MIRTLLTALTLLAATALSHAADEAKPAELKVGAYTFKLPAPWAAKPQPGMMSAGGFTLPGKDGAAPVEADFYHFGKDQGGGGNVESNIRRWQSQFQPGADGKPAEAVREEVTVEGKKALLITIKGTFLKGPAMSPNKTPMPGYAMLGAILQNDDGNVFIKVTGPEAPTLATTDEFKKVITTALGAK